MFVFYKWIHEKSTEKITFTYLEFSFNEESTEKTHFQIVLWGNFKEGCLLQNGFMRKALK